jgi:hypothetical protein
MEKTFKDYLKIVQESEQKLNTDLLRSILEKIKLELEVQLNKSDEYGDDWEEESIEIKKVDDIIGEPELCSAKICAVPLVEVFK